MAKQIIENPEDLEKSIAQRHEHRDVSLKAVIKAYIYFCIFAVVALPFSWLSIKGIMAASGHEQQYDQVVQPRESLPGGPLLQTNETTHKDIMDLTNAEHDRMNNYRSLPKEPNRVSVPVQKAMDEIVKNGLPATGGAAK